MLKRLFPTIRQFNEVLTGSQKKSVWVLLLLMLVSAATETFGISLIIPYFAVLTEPESFLNGRVGVIITKIFHTSGQNEILILLTAVLIVAFGLKYLLSYVIRLKQTNFINGNRFVMAQRLMGCLLREDYESHLYRNITEEINLVTVHVTWTFELIGAILSMVIQMLTVLFLGSFMLVVDWKITLSLGGGVAVLYCLFNRIFRNKVKLAGLEANQTWEEYEKTVGESFSMKKENDVFTRNDSVFDSFTLFGRRNMRADYRKTKYGIIPGMITNLISVWAILFFVLFSLASGNDIVGSIGKLSAFYLAVTRIIPGVNSIYSSVQHASFYKPSLDKVYSLLKSTDIMEDAETLNYKTCPMHSSIKLKDVSFRYKNAAEMVLDGINLEILRGERIGLVGKTGSGKTTLVNILIGLLKPISGAVSVDDVFLAGKSILDVGYVPQDTNLLDASIRDNIVFGRMVSDAELGIVMRASGLSDFVRQLPLGLDTEVGAQGVRLSGGQRQRIGIARALVGSPSVLIFDESTSSLDLKTEQDIVDTVKALGRDKTVIMISHRPNTLQFCDRWFCVENHRLKELSECP